jgi:uncharacterized membrane protein YhaH (DUF805 family)
MSGRRLYWAVTGFVLYMLAAFAISRRFASRMDIQGLDAPLASLILIILGCIGLVCAVACFIAVGPKTR